MRLSQDPANIVVDQPKTGGDKIKRLLSYPLLFLIGIGLGWLSSWVLPDMTYKPARINACLFIPAVLGMVVVVYYLSVAIHELGHLLGAILVKFQFYMMVLGPFQIKRQNPGLKLDYNDKGFVSGGFVLCVPLDAHNLRSRMTKYIIGGPLASLCLTILTYSLLFVLRDTPISLLPGLGLLCCLAIGLFFLAGSVWPRSNKGLLSDGSLLLLLLKGGPSAERMAILQALAGVSVAGLRPREYNPAWVEQAITATDGTAHEALAKLVGYSYALDQGDNDQAAKFLDRALSLWFVAAPFHQSLLFLEAAYFEARYGQDATTARLWLEKAKPTLLIELHHRRRAEAAVLLAEGDFVQAIEIARQGLSLIERSFNRGDVRVGTERLNEIITLSQENMSVGEVQESFNTPQEI